MICGTCEGCRRAARVALRDTSAAWWAGTWGLAALIIGAPSLQWLIGPRRRAHFLKIGPRIEARNARAQWRYVEAQALWLATAVHA